MKKIIIIASTDSPIDPINRELIRDTINRPPRPKRFSVTPRQEQPIESRKIFSPLDILNLLSEIEELSKFEIGLRPDGDGIALIVGNNAYTLLSDDAEMVIL